MSDEPPIKEAFSAIAQLAGRLGIEKINEMEGCWEHQVDGLWWIAVNGHTKPLKCSHGAEVPPINCYIEFNGWPAGIIDPFGGIIAAGAAANEDTFIDALNAAASS